MKRKLLLLAASVVVAAVAVSAAAAGGNPGLAVAGHVTNGGVPVSGATMFIQAWPNQATQLATPPGQRVSLDLAAVGKTAADGSYRILANLGNLPSRDVNPDETVNLHVMAFSHGRIWTTNLPTTVNSGAPQTANLTNATTTSCGIPNNSYWTSPYGPYDVKLGNAMADTGITGRITYSDGSSTSTTLGIAFYDGSSWSAGGTETNGTSSSVGFSAGSLQNDQVDGLWNYHTYVVLDGSTVCYKEAHPYEYVGRGDTNAIAHTYYGYCGGTYSAGDSYFQSSSNNGTFSAGLTLYGVSLSSQAGWESSMTLRYTFSAAGKVCGNTSQYEAAPRVEAELEGGGGGCGPRPLSSPPATADTSEMSPDYPC